MNDKVGPAGAFSVPPVIESAPLPVTSKPPELSVSAPPSVTVAGAVICNELMLVPSGTLGDVLAFSVTLLVVPQVVGSVLA